MYMYVMQTRSEFNVCPTLPKFKQLNQTLSLQMGTMRSILFHSKKLVTLFSILPINFYMYLVWKIIFICTDIFRKLGISAASAFFNDLRKINPLTNGIGQYYPSKV